MPDPVTYTQTNDLAKAVSTAAASMNTATTTLNTAVASLNTAASAFNTGLNSEETKLATSINSAVNAIKDLRAADGTLKPATVGLAQLKPEIRFAYSNRGAWTAATAYAVNDAVSYNNKYYACKVAHTSAATQTPDKVPANWNQIADLATLVAPSLAAALPQALVSNPAANTIARPIADRLNERMSVKDFGAVGDGVTDDTAALQKAFDWVSGNPGWWVDRNGRTLFIPHGVYKITDSLVLGINSGGMHCMGLTICGEGAIATQIRSYADNKPIIRVFGNANSLWEISHLGLAYDTPQTGHHANCFEFSNATQGQGYGIYNSHFHHLYMAGAVYSFATFEPYGEHFWGNRFDHIQINDMFGGFIYMGGVGGGQPSNTLDHFHMGSSERCVGPIFYTQGSVWNCGTVEINTVHNLGGPGGLTGSGTLPKEYLNPALHADGTKPIAGILDNFYGLWKFDTLHIESMSVVSDIVLFFNWGGMMKANMVDFFNDLHIREGITVFGFDASNSAMPSHIEVFRTDLTEPDVKGVFVLTPGHYGPPKPNQLRFFSFAGGQRPDSENFFLSHYDYGVGTEYLTIDGWNDQNSETFEPDADLVLDVDHTYGHTFKTLTANRTVTLPPSIVTNKGTKYTNLFSGRKFRITKRATSAFTLTVKDSANNVIAILPAGKKAWVEVVWNRGDTPTEWQVIGQATF